MKLAGKMLPGRSYFFWSLQYDAFLIIFMLGEKSAMPMGDKFVKKKNSSSNDVILTFISRLANGTLVWVFIIKCSWSMVHCFTLFSCLEAMILTSQYNRGYLIFPSVFLCHSVSVCVRLSLTLSLSEISCSNFLSWFLDWNRLIVRDSSHALTAPLEHPWFKQ